MCDANQLWGKLKVFYHLSYENLISSLITIFLLIFYSSHINVNTQSAYGEGDKSRNQNALARL